MLILWPDLSHRKKTKQKQQSPQILKKQKNNIAEYSSIKINLIRRVLLSFITLYFPFFYQPQIFCALDYIVAS